jgi:hypothetical protein
MDLAAIAPAIDLTPIATILIAVGLVGMWAGRPAAVGESAASVGTGLPWSASLSMLARQWRGELAAAIDAVVARLPLAARSTRSAPVAAPVAASVAAPVAASVGAAFGSTVSPTRARSAGRTDTRAKRWRRRAARPAVAPLAPRLTLDEQWSRIETHVARTITASTAAARLQASAVDQLDAADYAMIKLRAELAGVMKRPHQSEAARDARPLSPLRPAAARQIPLAA